MAKLAADDDEHCEIAGGRRAQIPDESLGRSEHNCVGRRPGGEWVGLRGEFTRQHARGDVGLQSKRILDDRLDCLFLPLRFGRQPACGSAHLIQRELGAHAIIDPGSSADRLSRAFRQIGDVERGSQKQRGGDPGGERFGHPSFGQLQAVLGDDAAVPRRQELEQ